MRMRMRMRFSLQKTVFITCFLIGVIIIWNVLRGDGGNFTKTCNELVEFQEDLHEFSLKVHKVLKELNFTHFLCYGSLWGQLRLSRLLPWENKVVMCLIYDDFVKQDSLYIKKFFKKKNLEINYNFVQGQFIVSNESVKSKIKVYLVLFEMDNLVHSYKRIGWIQKLLPSHCETIEILNCFPPRLILPPLPMKEFGKGLLPVPREGIEIQKYHYRDNWWKEIPIKNC